MTLHYADTSALVRCYFADESDHELLRELILEGPVPVVSSELARVEFASAVRVAYRVGRLDDPRPPLARFDADCASDGPVALVAMESLVVMPYAYSLVLDHALRTLDALHLAVVLTTVRNLAEEHEKVIVITRDDRQAEAAEMLGFTVV